MKVMADAKKIDPFDVEALEKSLNDSATRVSTIWVSFLIFSLYLLTAATTVTHRQLLLAEAVKLPVLNIELPLWGFFFLAPILFVIFHIYVLLQVLLLGRTAAAYNEALDKAVKPPPSNAAIRQRLANTLFAQIFAGSPHEREGWLGQLLRAVAWITLAIAPVAILLVFQFMFLPYHSHLASWTHRLLILVDLAATFLLWRLSLNTQRNSNWSGFRQWSALSVSCLLFIFFSLSLATFPGERHVNLFTGEPFSSVQCTRWFSEKFDRLHVPGVDVVDDDKLAKIVQATTDRKLQASKSERTQDFRERDFNCSDLSSADLRRVDLKGAYLYRANLNDAALQAASLGGARLNGASLERANLDEAFLDKAWLQDASLDGAWLRETSLNSAQLQGASLKFTQAQGASFYEARLEGVSLDNAQLQGASFDYVHLQGASLDHAQFQGASLADAGLQGASFVGAKLQGGFLARSWLQGSDLSDSALMHADLTDAYVWRANGAACLTAQVRNHKPDPIIAVGPELQLVEAKREQIEQFIERSVVEISNAHTRETVRRRMRFGLVTSAANYNTANIEQGWNECEATTKKREPREFDRGLAFFLRDFACNTPDQHKAVISGIITNWIPPVENRLTFSVWLARVLLGQGEKKCAATKDIDERTKAYLRDTLAAEANASASNTPDPERTPQ
jgi:uncharacterized protein YjbI with pentapeptide repeats